MSGDHNHKAAVRAFFGVAETGDYDVLDTILSPDYVLHDPGQPDEVRGVEGAKAMISTVRAACSDLRMTIEHQVAEGDLVASHYIVRGTHDGGYLGIPATGRPVTVTGLCMTRFRDGRIVEEWEVSDAPTLLERMGALPEPARD
jgi:steroid delta-isomerase-like uncharacterized protein